LKVEIEGRLVDVGAAQWGQLHRQSRQRVPFLEWLWQAEWVRAFLDGRRLEVWTVRDEDGRLVAALPLFQAEPGVFRIVGGTDVSDYLDLLAVAGREEEAWRALLDARGSSSDVWDLHCVPAASPTATALPGIARRAGLGAQVRVEERCPVLELPPSWDEYLASLTGKQRHELTRKMRRLDREVPAASVAALARPGDLELRLGDFFDLHRRSSAGKARFMDARMEAFFRLVVGGLAETGAARLWFLDSPEGPLASYLTLEWEGTVGLYNSGFRPERAAVAPGVVLLASLVRDAIARRCRRFDFLRGEERYKYDLGAVAEDVLTITLAPGPAAP
jgi:CelD/BcsL family acetyltransferase involved in cellulose biosynthesis